MNNAFNFGEPSGGGFIDTHFNFKQCQRSDGTIYGVPDTSDCAMKGSKEVKPNKGGEGGGGNNTKELLSSDNKSKLDKLGTHALRDVMDQVSKNATLAQSDKAKVIIEAAYKKHAAIEKSEGKTPMTITSIIPGATLKKLGIDPDKANVSAKAKPAGPKAKSSATAASKWLSKKENKDRLLKPKNIKTIADNVEGMKNWFEDEGYDTPKAHILGRMGTLNKVLLDVNAITMEDWQANVKDLKTYEVARGLPKMRGFDQYDVDAMMGIIAESKKKPAAKAKPTAKPKAEPKAKPEPRYSYEDNRKQYKQFYNMVRNQGLGHGDAAGAAEAAMRAKGFDPGDVSNQYRKEVREAFR